MATATQTLVLGGGCFWCTESVFLQVRGIAQVESGYSNGHAPKPSYEMVSTGTSGHNEVVRLEFDPEQVSLNELLEIFFLIHDPTTLNRQGPDVGDQYRSAIFFHSPEQEATAKASRDAAQPRFSRPIVTQITPAQTFWRAEEYHQKYLEKRGRLSCGI